jgi:uncharacterized protein (DUF58 family)
MARLRRPALRLQARLPDNATAQHDLAIPVRVTATGARAVPDLLLTLPRALRWGGSLRMEPAETLLDVPAGGSALAALSLRPLRRGRYELPGPCVRPLDPLGLVAGRPTRLPGRPLFVYPRFFAMDEFAIPIGRKYQPGGIPLSSSTGDAIEFVGTRDYREGDPVRNIHFRSWARRGRPVVKEYQEEYFCRIAVVLDTFLPRRPSAEQLRAFEAAITIVASIADHFSRSEYVVDILAAGPDLYEVSAGRSLAYLENILQVLACLEPSHEPPFHTIGPALFERLAQITTVVAVLQAWDAPRRDFLRRVRELGAGVRAVVVGERGPWEAAAGELGTISSMTADDVERALAGAGSPGPASGAVVA